MDSLPSCYSTSSVSFNYDLNVEEDSGTCYGEMCFLWIFIVSATLCGLATLLSAIYLHNRWQTKGYELTRTDSTASLQWHSILNIKGHDDVIKWKHTRSASLAICAGNSPVTGEFPSQRPVTLSFDFFFDLRLHKRLTKEWCGWWFDAPSRSLWRHCNVFWDFF